MVERPRRGSTFSPGPSVVQLSSSVPAATPPPYAFGFGLQATRDRGRSFRTAIRLAR
jgi:hypothetical protein